MDLSLNDLRYFEAIAETLNISRAAERLGISQPALSVALQKLESEMAVELLIRARSGVQLTHAGERLKAGAADFLNDWRRLRDTVIRGEEEPSGTYVLGCHTSVALYSLPHFLPQLLESHPIEVRLAHDLSRKITEGVISFRIDFGIVVNPWEHPDLVIRPLWNDVVTLYRKKKPTKLQDCDGEGVLICDPELAQSQSILKDINKAGLKFHRAIHTSNLEVVTSLTACGAGVGIIPGRVAGQASDLVPVEGAPEYHDQIALIYRGDRQHSKAARALARVIESLLKQPAEG
ncbi:MAG: LysR family transcriptional regulator [Deltaproteobacteria bacterium]|nr:LysR family transcriptional regulator [Deltaproteobacteria bacterium]MBI3295583.1 LysR family transcriptional regulator [Deltaproteobacteria bacterium]